MKKKKIILIVLIVMFIFYLIGSGTQIEKDKEIDKNTSNEVEDNNQNNNLNIKKDDKEEINNNKKLVVSNDYRFKNSVNKVTLNILNVSIYKEIEGIKPENDYFLVFDIEAITNLGFKTSHSYYFPYELFFDNDKMVSLNNESKFKYVDNDGNQIDVATLLNKEQDGVYVENNQVRAKLGLDYVNAGDGKRYIVFDIKNEILKRDELYLNFNGTYFNYHSEDVKDKKIYFKDYIVEK